MTRTFRLSLDWSADFEDALTTMVNFDVKIVGYEADGPAGWPIITFEGQWDNIQRLVTEYTRYDDDEWWRNEIMASVKEVK